MPINYVDILYYSVQFEIILYKLGKIIPWKIKIWSYIKKIKSNDVDDVYATLAKYSFQWHSTDAMKKFWFSMTLNKTDDMFAMSAR